MTLSFILSNIAIVTFARAVFDFSSNRKLPKMPFTTRGEDLSPPPNNNNNNNNNNYYYYYYYCYYCHYYYCYYYINPRQSRYRNFGNALVLVA